MFKSQQPFYETYFVISYLRKITDNLYVVSFNCHVLFVEYPVYLVRPKKRSNTLPTYNMSILA